MLAYSSNVGPAPGSKTDRLSNKFTMARHSFFAALDKLRGHVGLPAVVAKLITLGTRHRRSVPFSACSWSLNAGLPAITFHLAVSARLPAALRCCCYCRRRARYEFLLPVPPRCL